MVRVTVFVSGHVQGVGFRYATKECAKQFSVVGTVENLEDGRVKIVAEGEHAEVDRFLNQIMDQMRDFIHRSDRFQSEVSHSLDGFKILR